jgi:hypothetical protein
MCPEENWKLRWDAVLIMQGVVATYLVRGDAILSFVHAV